MSTSLEPVVFMLCGRPLYHGERGEDVDPAHPDACLCGEPFYLACGEYMSGGGFEHWTFQLAEEAP